MLGPVDYALWLFTVLVEAVGVFCIFELKPSRGIFPLTLYLCFTLAVDLGRYSILGAFGYSSGAYYYFYYYSDSLLTICLYFVLMGLYAHVFADMGVGKYLRGGAMLLLAGTVGISYAMVAASTDRLVARFAVGPLPESIFCWPVAHLPALGLDHQDEGKPDPPDATRACPGSVFQRLCGQLCDWQSVSAVRRVALYVAFDGHVAAAFLGLHFCESSRGCSNGYRESPRP